MTLLRAFTSLRHRNFRLFWFGQMISLTGSWMQIIGQTWLVLELTHSAVQLGLVGALEALPVLLFSLVGGVFADRWPKRRVLLWTRSAAVRMDLTRFVGGQGDGDGPLTRLRHDLWPVRARPPELRATAPPAGRGRARPEGPRAVS